MPIFEEYKMALEAGYKNCVFPLSTGAGKTYIFVTLSAIMGVKTLVLVHRENLLRQTKEQYQRFAPNLKVGLLKKAACGGFTTHAGTKIAESCDVLIGTYQWLKQNLDKIDFNKIKFVVLDEAHQCLSEQSVDLVNKAQENNCLIIGCSATPWVGERKEGSGAVETVYELFGFEPDGSDNPISGISLSEAISLGANCPISTIVVKVKPDKDIPFEQNDNGIFQAKVKGKLNTPRLNNTVVDFYINQSDHKTNIRYFGRKSIAFCSGIDHAEALAAAFNAIDINLLDPRGVLREAYADTMEQEYYDAQKTDFEAKHIPWNPKRVRPFDREKAKSQFKIAVSVHSKLSQSENQSRLEQHQKGGALIITGCDKILEGYDDPEVSMVLFPRLIESDRLKLQGIGRGTREYPGKYCTVVDFVYNDASIESICFAYSYISDDETVRFEYGNISERRASEVVARSDYQDGLIPRILIRNKAEYEIITEPQNAKVIIERKRKQEQLSAERQHRVKQRKLRPEELSISDALRKLCHCVETLHRQFDRLKDKVYHEAEDSEVTSESPKTTGKAEASSTEELQSNRLAVLDGSIILTRGLISAVRQAKQQLNAIKKFLNLTTKQPQKESDSVPAVEKNTILKTTQIEIQNLISECNALLVRLEKYLRKSTLGLSQSTEDEPLESPDEIVKSFDQMQERLRALSEMIMKEEESFVEQYKDALQRQQGGGSNRTKRLVQVSSTGNKPSHSMKPYLERASRKWFEKFPDATIMTWFVESLNTYGLRSGGLTFTAFVLRHFLSTRNTNTEKDCLSVFLKLLTTYMGETPSRAVHSNSIFNEFFESYSDNLNDLLFNGEGILHVLLSYRISPQRLYILTAFLSKPSVNLSLLNSVGKTPLDIIKDKVMEMGYEVDPLYKIVVMLLDYMGVDLTDSAHSNLLVQLGLKLSDDSSAVVTEEGHNLFFSSFEQLCSTNLHCSNTKIMNIIHDDDLKIFIQKDFFKLCGLIQHNQASLGRSPMLLRTILQNPNDGDFSAFSTENKKNILHVFFENYVLKLFCQQEGSGSMKLWRFFAESFLTRTANLITAKDNNGNTCFESVLVMLTTSNLYPALGCSSYATLNDILCYIDLFLGFPDAFWTRDARGVSALQNTLNCISFHLTKKNYNKPSPGHEGTGPIKRKHQAKVKKFIENRPSLEGLLQAEQFTPVEQGELRDQIDAIYRQLESLEDRENKNVSHPPPVSGMVPPATGWSPRFFHSGQQAEPQNQFFLEDNEQFIAQMQEQDSPLENQLFDHDELDQFPPEDFLFSWEKDFSPHS